MVSANKANRMGKVSKKNQFIPDSREYSESRGFLLTSAVSSAMDVIGPIESQASALTLVPLSMICMIFRL